MTDHTLAAPVRRALPLRHVDQARSVESCGMGSHVQSGAPVRALNARTSPLAGATSLLSAMADPVTTTSPTTTGGDVISNAGGSMGFTRRADRSSTTPFCPNAAHGFPSRASSAIRRPSMMGTMIRRRHAAVAGADASSQVATPRLVKSPYSIVRSILASNTQRTVPVAGSTGMTLPNGVLMYIVPSTTSGVTSSEASSEAGAANSGSVSRVRYVQATVSDSTLAAVIWVSGENLVPAASRP